MGLYGNIHVVPAEPDYWPPVNRELFLTLDDILVEDGRSPGSARQRRRTSPWAASGTSCSSREIRSLELTAKRGEVVRFYFTNTANTRVFNDAAGACMKLVGGDSGHYEHESFVEEVLLSPSERFVVDVLFEQRGEHVLAHRTPARSYRLASITVEDVPAEPALGDQFGVLRTNEDLQPSAGASPVFSTPLLTRRLPSSRRWTSTSLRERSTRVRCIQTSSARSRDAVLSAG